MVSLPQQLRQACAEFTALDSYTSKLEKNLADQHAELERLRREARRGAAQFDDVVNQQARREAAQGMLRQHLDDLARLQALVDELEAAQADMDNVSAAQDAFSRMREMEAEYATLSDQVEQYLAEQLSRLHDLEARHQAAQDELARRAHAQASKVTGLGSDDVRQVMQRIRRRLPSEEHRPLLESLRAFFSEVAGEEADRAEALTFDRVNVVPRYNTPAPAEGHKLLRTALQVAP